MNDYRTMASVGVLVVGGLLSVGIAQPANDHAMAVQAATGIISVTRSGDAEGRTVVLIPGLASGSDVWTSTAGAFQEYDLRIVQVAGFAGAAPFETDETYTDAIADAVNKHLIDSPGADPVVVGHSLGGFVALKAALADETPITELVIVDSLPFLAGLFMPGATPEQAAQMAPAFAQQMADMPRKSFDQQQLAGLARLVKDKPYQSVLADWSKASDQATVATAVGELLAADLREDIAQIEAEITVLVAHDKMMGVPVTQVRDLFAGQYAAAPDAQVVVIEESLHFIMVDQTTLFHETLDSALTD